MAETTNDKILTKDADLHFKNFMDVVAVSDQNHRNKLINDWLAVLNEDDQVRLVRKLQARGIFYNPQANKHFFEV